MNYFFIFDWFDEVFGKSIKEKEERNVSLRNEEEEREGLLEEGQGVGGREVGGGRQEGIEERLHETD